jgi:hypothetical protein
MRENVDLLMRLLRVVILDDRHLMRKRHRIRQSAALRLVSVVAKPHPCAQIGDYCGPEPPSRSLAAT